MRLFRYASYFPDLPGQTGTINHFASELRAWHTKALSIYEDLGYALHGYTEWQGKAQEEFVSTVVAERGQMDALCEGLSRAYQAVEAFAGVCYNQYWEVADIRYRAEQLDAYYDGLSWSEAWEQSSAIDAQFALLKALYGDVKARRAQAEADCAAVLREALHVEPVDIRKPDDADQSPFNASELRAMSQGTLDSLAEEIEHGSHPPFAIALGSIGDCYFLASVGAFAQTQRGRDYLYSLVRVHRDAEGAVDGFLVTMPGTPHDPNPSGEDTVFVSDTYVRGANGAHRTSPPSSNRPWPRRARRIPSPSTHSVRAADSALWECACYRDTKEESQSSPTTPLKRRECPSTLNSHSTMVIQ